MIRQQDKTALAITLHRLADATTADGNLARVALALPVDELQMVPREILQTIERMAGLRRILCRDLGVLMEGLGDGSTFKALLDE